MSYLFCEKCYGYYQLQPGESADDFEDCKCGGTLVVVNDLENHLKSLKSDSEVIQKPIISKEDVERLETNKDVDGLIDVLKYGNPELKSFAAVSLGILGDERSFEHLLAAINDEDAIVRESSIVALSKFRNKKFLEIILPEIQDEDHIVREGVIKAFENIGGDLALKNIVKGLKDKHYAVRARAALALGNMGDKRATKYLIDSLDDDHEIVRSKVEDAIRKIEDEETASNIIDLIEESN